MDIQTFIDETIRQILNGTASAQKYARNEIGGRADAGNASTKVDFDLAVVSYEENSSEMKGKAHVVVLGAGGSSRKTDSVENVSRVKFVIPVRLPSDEPVSLPEAVRGRPSRV